VNELLLRVALRALQAASATSQNQGTEKGEAPLGCQQQSLSHQLLIYLYELARHKYQRQAKQPLHRIDNHAKLRTESLKSAFQNQARSILPKLRIYPA
jgi:hypothetical protein